MKVEKVGKVKVMKVGEWVKSDRSSERTGWN